MRPRDFRLRCEKEDLSKSANCHVLAKLKTITYSKKNIYKTKPEKKNSGPCALNLNRYCYYFYIKSVRGFAVSRGLLQCFQLKGYAPRISVENTRTRGIHLRAADRKIKFKNNTKNQEKQPRKTKANSS